MSYPKKDRVFPVKPVRMTEAELADLVASALRHDYGDLPSAVKQIGLQTGANLRAIRNWYEGRHAPSSIHLLRLAKSSPQILQLVLRLIGGEELADAFSLLTVSGGSNAKASPKPNMEETYGEKNCTIDSEILENLNRRQRWFIDQLQAGRAVRPRDLCTRWQVSLRTAKADVAQMNKAGLVAYYGSKRAGAYALLSLRTKNLMECAA